MPPTFSSLGVSADLCDALAERGITTAFPIQSMAIPDGLAGRDICGKAKTGSGKTLAFGIPVIEQLGKAEPGRPTGIALVPTRELAVQVRDELDALAATRGLNVTAIYGGSDIDKQIRKLEKGVDLVIATPGRMIDLIERGEVTVAAVTHIVIDEADRMADMGFMPQVEWVLRHAKSVDQTLLFSATLDGAVDGLIQRYQTDPVVHSVAAEAESVDRMEHRFIQVHQMDKAKVAASIARSSSRTLLFSRTKRGADRLAEALQKEGVKVAPIHGDLRQVARERALSDFQEGKLVALVATDVAARGIHVDDVDVVVHYDPPEDHKTYLHRSGRTARAGSAGLVVTLVLWDQELEVKRLQKRVGLNIPIVEMFSNDPRLSDLVAWDPSSVSA
ncbi:MAG: DEAD/DEAH box helicase [Acidimicrobiales bacterium]|nr:DEAD/DEAH box helicase [Acidimicrobiales bacterium]